MTNKTKIPLKNKFDKLTKELIRKFNISHKDGWLVNLSSKMIPQEITLLSLGSKFVPPTETNDLPIFKIITDGEECIQTLQNKEDKEAARIKLPNIVDKHIRGFRHNERDRYVISMVKKTRRFLKDNKDVLVMEADKGNVTVIMDRTDYESRMEDHLSDTSK